jgi:PAS domain S-box-containing protein
MPIPGSDAARFRRRLLAAMMLGVAALVALALVIAQRSVETEVRQSLQAQFQSELGAMLGVQEARLAAIRERCRRLASSVRIRASLEESDIEDLYLNAEVELRGFLANDKARDGGARFYHFLDAHGSLLAREEKSPGHWESQLMVSGINDEQQVGYVADSENKLFEVVATPIVATDTGEVIGAIVLGFDPPGRGSENVRGGILTNGTLYPDAPWSSVLASGDFPESGLAVTIDGAPHSVFVKALNPGSHFPLAYEVCAFPLAEKMARLSGIRWKIVASGVALLVAGLAACHFAARRFAAPVAKLAEVSAENAAQRERAEAALELTEQKYRAIFENAVEGIFVIAPDGRFVSANPALARILGHESPAQLLAEPAESARFAPLLRAVERDGTSAAIESEFVRRDGGRIWVSQRARAVRDGEGRLQHFEGTLEDVTERKRAADELLALNSELKAALANLQSTQQQIIQQERLRALGQMASGIAHDFNNTLVPILGFCELLMLNPAILEDRKKALGYIETIQTAAKDASSVVSRLREFYRLDKSDRAIAPVHLKKLVEQSVALTRPKWKDQAQASGATIDVSLELEAVPAIPGEESALREVLTNLIFNAVDAMPRGGTLTLRTRRDGDTAVLEVADTGTGMTEEVRRRCFDPFFSTKGDRGTGLGLSMVFGIVQRHSGALDVRSAVGKGTTFTITVPLLDAPVERTVLAPASAMQRALRVLVVDDEAPVRETLDALLTADGHEVVLAENGADGLQRFMGGRFDLVVTDKAMPRMSGDQMASAIKRVSRTPVILLTGFGLFHEKSEFPDVDVLASKPIRFPALREAITNAIRAA